MSKQNPVMSSFMWAERLGVELPDPLPWDLYALLTEAEFTKRVGTANSKSKRRK